jgi:hypothetical protein
MRQFPLTRTDHTPFRSPLSGCNNQRFDGKYAGGGRNARLCLNTNQLPRSRSRSAQRERELLQRVASAKYDHAMTLRDGLLKLGFWSPVKTPEPGVLGLGEQRAVLNQPTIPDRTSVVADGQR